MASFIKRAPVSADKLPHACGLNGHCWKLLRIHHTNRQLANTASVGTVTYMFIICLFHLPCSKVAADEDQMYFLALKHFIIL